MATFALVSMVGAAWIVNQVSATAHEIYYIQRNIKSSLLCIVLRPCYQLLLNYWLTNQSPPVLHWKWVNYTMGQSYSWLTHCQCSNATIKGMSKSSLYLLNHNKTQWVPNLLLACWTSCWLRAKPSLFCHVYSNTNCFKIVTQNVTQASVASAISGHVRLSYWNLITLLKCRLIVTNMLSNSTLENIYWKGKHKSMTNKWWVDDNANFGFFDIFRGWNYENAFRKVMYLPTLAINTPICYENMI